MGKPTLPIPSPVWDLNGLATGMGPMRDLIRLAHAHAIPTVPTVAHPSPTWDWTGLAIWVPNAILTDLLSKTL